MDITDIIIAKKLAGGGGGSSLPEVTSADEGKVLAVNASGEWAADDSILTIENDGIGVSYNQLKDMLLHHKRPYFIIVEGESPNESLSIYNLIGISIEEGQYIAGFVGNIDNVLSFTSASADGILFGD